MTLARHVAEGGSMAEDVLMLLTDRYRQVGPFEPRYAVRDLLLELPRATVESQLATLLDGGAIAPADPGTVWLTPRVRATFFSPATLSSWLRTVRQPPFGNQQGALLAVREELRALCGSCLVASEGSGLGHRAVEIAAVLAMADLDPRAMDVVVGLPGPPRAQVTALTEGFEASCSSLTELEARARRYVSTYRREYGLARQ